MLFGIAFLCCSSNSFRRFLFLSISFLLFQFLPYCSFNFFLLLSISSIFFQFLLSSSSFNFFILLLLLLSISCFFFFLQFLPSSSFNFFLLLLLLISFSFFFFQFPPSSSPVNFFLLLLLSIPTHQNYCILYHSLHKFHYFPILTWSSVFVDFIRAKTWRIFWFFESPVSCHFCSCTQRKGKTNYFDPALTCTIPRCNNHSMFFTLSLICNKNQVMRCPTRWEPLISTVTRDFYIDSGFLFVHGNTLCLVIIKIFLTSSAFSNLFVCVFVYVFVGLHVINQVAY